MCNICHMQPDLQDVCFVCSNEHVVCIPCLLEGSRKDMKTCPICRERICLKKPGPYLSRLLKEHHKAKNFDDVSIHPKNTDVDTFHKLLSYRVLEFNYRSLVYYASLSKENIALYLDYVHDYDALLKLKSEIEVLEKKIQEIQNRMRITTTNIYNTFRENHLA